MDLGLDDGALPQKIRLDQLDEDILWELGRDARIANNALAEKLHVSASTTLTRTRALREAGILMSSHAQIDLRQVGLPLQAIVAVRLRAQARAAIKSYAAKVIMLPAVLNIFFIGGQDDFLIHVACTSPEQLRDFVATNLSMDPAVATTQTYIVFEHLIGSRFMDGVDGFKEMRADIS